MSHKHLFVTLLAVSLMVSGFAPAFAEEPSGGGLGWIGVLIVLILLIPLVWWLMRSSGTKGVDAHASTRSADHAGIEPVIAETHAAPQAQVETASAEKEPIQSVTAQASEAPANGRDGGEAGVAKTEEPAPNFAATAQEAAAPTRGMQASSKPDDLVVIEGIGPKISRILQENGIKTFAELAAADLNRVEDILNKAGLSNITDPTTWPEQAQLAADGKWDELKALKNTLKRGRRV